LVFECNGCFFMEILGKATCTTEAWGEVEGWILCWPWG
jgi:hypothetical protein